MKRSEALQIIENELFDLDLDPNNPGYCSNKILTALENSGVLTPSYKKYNYEKHEAWHNQVYRDNNGKFARINKL